VQNPIREAQFRRDVKLAQKRDWKRRCLPYDHAREDTAVQDEKLLSPLTENETT